MLKAKTILLTPVFRAEINKLTISSSGSFSFKSKEKSCIDIGIEFRSTTKPIKMFGRIFIRFWKDKIGFIKILILREFFFLLKWMFHKCPVSAQYLGQISYNLLMMIGEVRSNEQGSWRWHQAQAKVRSFWNLSEPWNEF